MVQQGHPIEITITHNFGEPELTRRLWVEGRIGIRWFRVKERLPTYEKLNAVLNPDVRLEDDAFIRAVREVWLIDTHNLQQLCDFHRLARDGGAVVASYKGAAPTGVRLVGRVVENTFIEIRPDADPETFFPLLTLPLIDPRHYESTSCFLGNLAPRMRTLQSCDARAVGRLWTLANGHGPERTVGTVHPKDVEWLVSNWLTRFGAGERRERPLCATVYSGGASDEAVDHKGWDASGNLVQAQTTVSPDISRNGPIEKKLDALKNLGGRKLLFAPASVRSGAGVSLRARFETEVDFIALEDVFRMMDGFTAGSRMIDSLITARHAPAADTQRTSVAPT